jgi:hypothetical protein
LKANPKIATQFSGLYPIHIACKLGAIECLKYFISDPNLLNAQTPNNNITLHFAAQSSAECVLLLLSTPGINPNLKNIFGDTPATSALKSGQNTIFSLFVEKSFSYPSSLITEMNPIQVISYSKPDFKTMPNLIDFYQTLLFSIQQGHINELKAIINKIQKSSFKIPESNFLELITASCNNGNSKLIELLSYILDLNKTPIVSLSVQFGLSEWISKLKKFGIILFPSTNETILDIATRNNKKKMINIIFQEVDIIDS